MFDWLGFTTCALSEGIVHCFQILSFLFFFFFLQLHKLQSSLNIPIILVYAGLRGVSVLISIGVPHRCHHSTPPPCCLQRVYVHLIYGPEGN